MQVGGVTSANEIYTHFLVAMLQSSLDLTFSSLMAPLARPRIWFYLAWLETLNQYRRTVLGPFWILISLVVFSVAMGSVYSGLFSVDFKQYVSYITTGMMGWNWANAILIASGVVYTQNASMLLDYPTDKAYLLWSHVMAQLLVFLHQLPLIVLFYLLGLVPLTWNVLYLIPSLILVFLINLGAASMLAILVNRYRDLNRILTSFTIIIMMTTPIFWMPSMAGGVPPVLYLLNPFYYIIEILREPMLGHAPSALLYGVSSAMALLLLLFGSIAHKRYSKFVVFRL